MAKAKSRSTVVQPLENPLVGSSPATGAESVTTTLLGGAVPAAPTWMCAAVAGSVMPCTLISQQTSSCPGLTIMVAVPLPSRSPGGTSAAPVSSVERGLPPWSATSSRAADAAPASAKATSAAKTNDNNSRLAFMPTTSSETLYLATLNTHPTSLADYTVPRAGTIG